MEGLGFYSWRGRFFRVAVLFVLQVSLVSCGPAQPLQPEPPGAISVEFQQICQEMLASDVPFMGQRERGAASQPKDPAPPPTAPGRDLDLWRAAQLALSTRLLIQGEAEEALVVLEDLGDASDWEPAAARKALRKKRLIAHLLIAENQNCVLDHSAGNCILPFRDDAIHRKKEHGRSAGDLALEMLAEDPNSFESRWILNLMRMVTNDYPEGVPARYRLPDDVFESDTPMPRWWNRGPALGIAEPDRAGGAILDDFDGDGLLDIVTSTIDPCKSLKAYRNDGTGGFIEVTKAWGLDTQLGGLNLMHADYDNDGDLDLLVLRGAWQGGQGRIRNSLLRNDLDQARGSFVDMTRAAGLAEPAYPTQTAGWADYDNDGDLDLYIGNESHGRALEHPSQLFRNNGNGTFSDMASFAGVTNNRYAKGVAWGDFDDDGDPDLYVSNFSGGNRLYRNNGDGTFSDVARERGVLESTRQTFATWFFDYDNDGDLDLFMADYSAEIPEVMASYFAVHSSRGRPLIYRNDRGYFQEIGAALGLNRPALPMGANFGDLDNDGWLDIYLGTGDTSYLALTPNLMLRNIEGVRFADVSFSAGVAHLQKGHGVAFGDLDNDGDQDLLHQLGGALPGDSYGNALFENPGTPNHWVTLRLEGRRANRFGVGARIEVRVASGEERRSIYVEVNSGGSFGGSSFQQEIGLGRADRIEEIRIRWPGSSEVQIFRDVEFDAVYTAVEGAGSLKRREVVRFKLRDTPQAAVEHQHGSHVPAGKRQKSLSRPRFARSS